MSDEQPTWRDRLLEGTRDVLERRTGYTLEAKERLSFLEESDLERRMIQKDLDLMAYTALNYVGGSPQDLKPTERRRLIQRSRVVWMKDPQAGAAVDLMNDFTFGRGMQKPKANDPDVQEVIDEAWADPDNQLVLTSFQAQLALGTDMELQSNLFLLIFEDGEDGKVKLGLLDHDTVETVVRDPDNRLRILYYVARHYVIQWDFNKDQPVVLTPEGAPDPNRGQIGAAPTKAEGSPLLQAGQGTMRYYEHWRNVEDVEQDVADGVRAPTPLCPPQKLGDGKVFHVAINRGSEMAFGHPRMDRLIRWFNAYNNFMDARVDIMAASAAFVMKRKVKGTPQQLERMANQALSRRSVLGMSGELDVNAQLGPKAAGVLTENDTVEHSDFNINTNAPAAAQDAQMLRSQISAATRWPASYYGDASQSSLATATSLELPVLKTVETRQEIFESIVRFFIDRVIERAVDTGRISDQVGQTGKQTGGAQKTKAASDKPDRAPQPSNTEPTDLQNAYQGATSDEDNTSRDLGYEFKMPSPLKRLLGDVVTAVQAIATAFDPNNSNTQLSRTLMTIALGELDIEDPAGAVEKIFPQGYVDPMVAAQEGPPGGGAQPPQFSPDASSNPFGGGGGGGFGQDQSNGYSQGFGGGNPYGASQGSQSPEDAMEAAMDRNSARVAARAAHRAAEINDQFDAEIAQILSEA